MLSRVLQGVLCLGLLLPVACHAPMDPKKSAQAKADASAMMQALQLSNVKDYRARSLPPPDYRRMQAGWTAIRAKMQASAEEQARFNALLRRFTEPKAEAHLQRDLNAKIKPINSEIKNKWPLMQTSLTLLLQGWVETNPQLSTSEKAHGKALVKAIISQMPAEWLQDQALRQKAFDQMVRIARDTEVPDYQAYSALNYSQFNGKLAHFIDGLKALGRIYGLDWNAGMQRRTLQVTAQSGNTATVRIRYPLGKKWVEFPMDLIEYQGRWYDASAAQLLNDTLATP
jgi:hypothetical protein